MAKRQALVVEAVLKGISPKKGNTGYSSSSNTLELTLEVKLPMPSPPLPRDQWQHPDKWNHQTTLRQLKEKLEKGLGKPERLPKGQHYWEPGDASTEAICKTCGNAKPGTIDACVDPVLVQESRLGKAQLELRKEEAAIEVRVETDYQAYVEKQNLQVRQSFQANVGAGLFMALLGQEVVVHFFPSSRVFQPLLDVALALPAGAGARTFDPEEEADE